MPSSLNNSYNPTMYLLKGAQGTPGYTDSSIDRPREMNRYMGGHRRNNHPYISGYWYLIIEPPHRIFDSKFGATSSGTSSGTPAPPAPPAPNTTGENTNQSQNQASNAPFQTTRWLHSTAESFTPPTRTLTKVDIPALGGVGSSYIAGQQLTRTFSVTFREYQDTPILNILNLWTSVIDHHYGISPLEGNEYIPANYKGNAFVFLCKPTASFSNKPTITEMDVEQFFYFEGVFPEGAPTDSLNSDINTNDAIQLNVTFSFDGWPYGKEHQTAFKVGLNRLRDTYDISFQSTYDNHISENAPPFKEFNVPGKSGITNDF